MAPQQGEGQIGGGAAEHVGEDDDPCALVQPLGGIIQTAHSGTSWAMSTLMEVQSLRVPRMNSAVRSMAEP